MTTFKLFEEWLPRWVGERTLIMTKSQALGFVVGAPPIGDAAFAEKFNGLGVSFLSHQPQTDLATKVIEYAHFKKREIEGSISELAVNDGEPRTFQNWIRNLFRKIKLFFQQTKRKSYSKLEQVLTDFNIKTRLKHVGTQLNLVPYGIYDKNDQEITSLQKLYQFAVNKPTYMSHFESIFGIPEILPSQDDDRLYAGDRLEIFSYTSGAACKVSLGSLNCPSEKPGLKIFRIYKVDEVEKVPMLYDRTAVQYGEPSALYVDEKESFLEK